MGPALSTTLLPKPPSPFIFLLRPPNTGPKPDHAEPACADSVKNLPPQSKTFGPA